MRVPRRGVTDLAGALAWLTELEARTVVLDVEPLVASWDTGAELLDAGVGEVVAALAALPSIEVVGFATNSLRRLGPLLPDDGPRVFYVAAARKPLLTRPYRDLPRPGVLVGDQVLTDGLLAWRLGYAFAHVQHGPRRIPLGPRAMRSLGAPLLRVLFEPA